MSRVVDRTGLNERLRQHSRQSGMLVGVSMACAIALTIGAFVWIFFRIDPYLTDFTGRTGAVHASPVAALGGSVPARPAASPTGAGGTVTPTAPPAATATATAPGPTPAAALPPAPTPTALAAPSPTATPGFVATHQVVEFGERVNLRAGPTASSGRIQLLPPGTKLKFLNEQEQAGDVLWMKFQTERGDVGWIRNLDVRPIR
jgi:hypothetical protein